MAGLGDLVGLMRNLGAMRERAAEIQADLARQTAEGSAGGGMVTATVNGRQELIGLKIDPAIVDREDVALVEEMVKGAVAQAMAKARDLQREAMAKLIGDLPIPPGLLEMFSE
jgi:hypothetical protein